MLNCTPATPTLSVAVAETVTAAPDTVAPAAGAVIATVGAVVSALLTVTLTAADVVVLPAASRATAVNVCRPLAVIVVFHVCVWGMAVSSAPRLMPSSLNCTPATPTLSVAVAEIVTAVPDTVAPAAGAVIATVGAVVSALLTVTLTAADVVVLPAASRATAVNVCRPFAVVVVFQVCVWGLAVSSAPRLMPSSLNCTPATPTLSVAVAEIVTAVPDTVAPAAGAVIATVGAVVSALLTVTLTAADVVVFPAASRATAVSVCVPFANVVVLHVWLSWLAVSSAPR